MIPTVQELEEEEEDEEEDTPSSAPEKKVRIMDDHGLKNGARLLSHSSHITGEDSPPQC